MWLSDGVLGFGSSCWVCTENDCSCLSPSFDRRGSFMWIAMSVTTGREKIRESVLIKYKTVPMLQCGLAQQATRLWICFFCGTHWTDNGTSQYWKMMYGLLCPPWITSTVLNARWSLASFFSRCPWLVWTFSRLLLVCCAHGVLILLRVASSCEDGQRTWFITPHHINSHQSSW